MCDYSKTAVDLGERYADRQATMANFGDVPEVLNDILQDVDPDADELGRASHMALACITDRLTAAGAAGFAAQPSAYEDGAVKAALLRDIFANPFLRIACKPTWLTSTVTNLAQAIYDDRAFDRMPILADALEDAGCTDAGILEHCRGGGVHARGCWVVDLLLGKE